MKSGKHQVLVLFIAAAGLLVTGIVSIYRAGMVAVESRRDVSRQNAVIQHLNGMVSALKDAETSQRGFLLTAEERYLSPMQQALGDYRTERDALWAAASNGLLASNDVASIQSLAQNDLTELDESIRQRREQGAAQPLKSPTDRGERLMDDVAARVRVVIDAKERALELAVQDADDALARAHGVFLLAALLNLAFLMWACWRIYREMDRREAAVLESGRMAEALRQSGEELERLVAERTEQLQEMVNELRHVSYAITHDMRAPLRAMNAFAELLVADPAGPDARRHCERIRIAAGRLDRLIQDSLNYTRATLIELPRERVELDGLLRGLIDTYPNLSSETADVEIDGNLPAVIGNESLLTQCFSNLLGNAVKFVPPGTRPHVHVRAETQEDRVRIWVEDNGIGIPREAQYRLFGMFQKLENDYEGTGIGLAIVRKVVERMGGSVGVISEPGRGSRFWVELNRAQ